MVLTLVTASLVGGTFAKYTSTANGSAKATVAAWSIAFKADDETVSQDKPIAIVTDNSDGRMKDVIVPGDQGELKFAIDGKGSEVGFTYKIELEAANPDQAAVKFYKNAACAADDEITGALTGTVYYSETEADMKEEVTVYWMLPEDASNEVADMDCIYNVTLTAEQSTALAPVAP